MDQEQDDRPGRPHADVSVSIWYADGPGSPRLAPAEAVRLARLPGDEPRIVTLGWTIEPPSWITADDGGPTTNVRTTLAGYGLADAVNSGRVVALPVRISSVPCLIESDPPDVAVVSGLRRGGTLALTGAVGWADVLARTARHVVVEIDEDGDDVGAPEIAGNVVATVPRPSAPGSGPASSRPADDTDLRIGALVASLFPEEPTLQFGPGGIGEGIARAITVPVSVWSGLVTDAVADLHRRGLLLAPVVAAYVWGERPVRFLAGAGMLRPTSATITNDLSRLSSIPRLIGCNTALQVGLDGAVNVERVGRRIITGVGGHADFCVGASRSVGGCSVIALRSTTARGASTIVPAVDVVSTPRADIQVVVTEHGIADLRGIGDDERARRLIGIAAPEHREALLAGRRRT